MFIKDFESCMFACVLLAWFFSRTDQISCRERICLAIGRPYVWFYHVPLSQKTETGGLAERSVGKTACRWRPFPLGGFGQPSFGEKAGSFLSFGTAGAEIEQIYGFCGTRAPSCHSSFSAPDQPRLLASTN